MNCHEVKDHCSDYVDCCLDEKQEELDRHLSECPACRKKLSDFRFVVDAVRRLPEEDVPPDFIVRLNENLDKELMGFWSRAFTYVSSISPNRALAFAATFALVVIGAFYITAQQVPSTMTAMSGTTGGTVQPSIVGTVSSPSVMRPVSSEINLSPAVSSRSALRTVSAGYSAPAPTESPAEAIAGRAGISVPERLVGTAPYTTPGNKAPYVDKVIILRTSHPSVAANQVRTLADQLHGMQLDYSETIIFVMVPIQFSEPFIQALESAGSLEVIDGPIERGLQTALFQVIVIPD